jgi:hypothetical protein
MFFTPGERIIRKRGIWTYKHVIFKCDAVPELHAAFHGHAIADDDFVFNEYAIANIAV